MTKSYVDIRIECNDESIESEIEAIEYIINDNTKIDVGIIYVGD